MPSAVCTLYIIVCDIFAWSLHTSSGKSYFLLQNDIRFGIIRSKHAAASFFSLINILPDILCMSEIMVSNNAAFSELHLGLAHH